MPATPRRPTSIVVGPYRFRVGTVAKLRPVPGSPDLRKDAECDFDAGTITIRRDQTRDRAKVLLVHEVLHALVDLCGLDQPAGPLSPRVEENVVNALAPALLDVLRRNPRLAAYLLAE